MSVTTEGAWRGQHPCLCCHQSIAQSVLSSAEAPRMDSETHNKLPSTQTRALTYTGWCQLFSPRRRLGFWGCFSLSFSYFPWIQKRSQDSLACKTILSQQPRAYFLLNCQKPNVEAWIKPKSELRAEILFRWQRTPAPCFYSMSVHSS